MKSKVSRAAQASKSVYHAGGEHYHFNMACLENGEARVLASMQDEIRERQQLSFEDSAVAAASEFKMMKRLESGEGRFKAIRERLSASEPRSVHTTLVQGLLA
ncbi:hypothetical protein QVM48_16955 [Pseudomonas soli]|jgi:hypothetical protein|uniref:hypothetical protein n=1 Tax=Pseudomonas soli TaxID=1306993 RepID=UPI00289549BE|nr:hypothetical protein [Pseudomonas soli]MDT3716702.1 hypothetical protein [Pseudomonas soli]MDT3733547.1 hypothetical protein [Pseudomonas soli]